MQRDDVQVNPPGGIGGEGGVKGKEHVDKVYIT